MNKLLFLVFFLFLVGCEIKIEITTSLNEGYDIVTINNKWEDAGCVLTIDKDTSYNMLVNKRALDITELGEYEITYNLEHREQDYTCTRIVKVIDDIAPVLILNSSVDTIIVGETWTDAGVVATDNLDTELTVVVEGNVDTSTTGRYIITYTTTDTSLNEAVIIRVVNVIE